MTTTIIPGDLDIAPAGASQSPPPDRTKTALFSWALVAVSLVLAAILAIRALGSDGDDLPTPWFSVEHGSIAAIDHAAEDEPASLEGSLGGPQLDAFELHPGPTPRPEATDRRLGDAQRGRPWSTTAPFPRPHRRASPARAA